MSQDIVLSKTLNDDFKRTAVQSDSNSKRQFFDKLLFVFQSTSRLKFSPLTVGPTNLQTQSNYLLRYDYSKCVNFYSYSFTNVVRGSFNSTTRNILVEKSLGFGPNAAAISKCNLDKPQIPICSRYVLLKIQN